MSGVIKLIQQDNENILTSILTAFTNEIVVKDSIINSKDSIILTLKMDSCVITFIPDSASLISLMSNSNTNDTLRISVLNSTLRKINVKDTCISNKLLFIILLLSILIFFSAGYFMGKQYNKFKPSQLTGDRILGKIIEVTENEFTAVVVITDESGEELVQERVFDISFAGEDKPRVNDYFELEVRESLGKKEFLFKPVSANDAQKLDAFNTELMPANAVMEKYYSLIEKNLSE